MSDIEYLKKYYDGNLEYALEDLKKGVPVQYIVGNVDFYGITLKVDQRVLIPRFETEELVSKVLEYSKNFDNPRIADIGTGSGAIAIALKKKICCEMIATDISSDALDVAKENARLNSVNIDFREGNLLEPLDGKFDIIVSNPPYIAYDEEIMEIVKNNEPHIALYADHDGLYYYEEMLKKIGQFLNKKYVLAFEIGSNQGEALKKLIKTYLKKEAIVEKDMSGRDRFLIVKNTGF